jgi:hypothetical protein
MGEIWHDIKDNLDFKPKNSEFKNVEVNVCALNFGLGFNF